MAARVQYGCVLVHVAGSIVAAVWHFAGNPLGMEPLWPACGTTIVVLVALTLASKTKVSAGTRVTKRRATSLLELRGGREAGRIPIPVEVGMFDAYGLTFLIPVFIR